MVKNIKKIAIIVIICIVVLLLTIAISYLCGVSAQKKKQAEIDAKQETMQMVDSHYISGKLQDMSELTTQKLTYSGVIEVTEGKIPFITQKGFLMTYTAKIRAGIDLSRSSVECNTDSIVITIPAAEIQSVDIDPETIDFHAEKTALFNWKENQDVTDAISLAKADVEEKGDVTELLEQANENAKMLISKLLEGMDDRTIEVHVNQTIQE